MKTGWYIKSIVCSVWFIASSFPFLLLFAVKSTRVSLFKLSSDLSEYFYSSEFLETATCPSVYKDTLTMEKHTEFSVCERWRPRRRGAFPSSKFKATLTRTKFKATLTGDFNDDKSRGMDKSGAVFVHFPKFYIDQLKSFSKLTDQLSHSGYANHILEHPPINGMKK